MGKHRPLDPMHMEFNPSAVSVQELVDRLQPARPEPLPLSREQRRALARARRSAQAQHA